MAGAFGEGTFGTGFYGFGYTLLTGTLTVAVTLTADINVGAGKNLTGVLDTEFSMSGSYTGGSWDLVEESTPPWIEGNPSGGIWSPIASPSNPWSS